VLRCGPCCACTLALGRRRPAARAPRGYVIKGLIARVTRHCHCRTAPRPCPVPSARTPPALAPHSLPRYLGDRRARQRRQQDCLASRRGAARRPSREPMARALGGGSGAQSRQQGAVELICGNEAYLAEHYQLGAALELDFGSGPGSAQLLVTQVVQSAGSSGADYHGTVSERQVTFEQHLADVDRWRPGDQPLYMLNAPLDKFLDDCAALVAHIEAAGMTSRTRCATSTPATPPAPSTSWSARPPPSRAATRTARCAAPRVRAPAPSSGRRRPAAQRTARLLSSPPLPAPASSLQTSCCWRARSWWRWFRSPAARRAAASAAAAAAAAAPGWCWTAGAGGRRTTATRRSRRPWRQPGACSSACAGRWRCASRRRPGTQLST
jgi:hypothetical protein